MQSLLIGQIAPGCLVLLFSCQRHSVSHGQGLNSSRAEGTGLLMEALCSLVTFTAPLETSWWPIRCALWVGATVLLSLSTKSFCHCTTLKFSPFVISLTYFPRSVLFFCCCCCTFYGKPSENEPYCRVTACEQRKW